ncbi:16815_t:CDS:2 [Acaulospora colombiana]|uniref:16815_t:CDS:1 n=1 Tax=Acaulospora colombiana TaxID=27376 RepID=A0ACA9MAN0_9GLOM|nr:16815_t:CDS:2 [Acaulospora colombiana]
MKIEEPNYEWLEGRACENDKNGPYLLPIDSGEIDKLDFQHYIIRYVLTSYFTAPIDMSKVEKVCGCGSGIWTMENATMFPKTSFVGIDVRTMVPEEIRPPNCEFRYCDIFEGLDFPRNHFDYIYQRSMLSSIPEKRWNYVIKELIRCTKPGGYVELTEMQIGLHNQGPYLKKLHRYVNKAFELRGIYQRTIKRLPKLLAKSGLVDVSVKSISIPCGHWGGQVGEWMRDNVIEVIKAYKLFCIKQGVIGGGNDKEGGSRRKEGTKGDNGEEKIVNDKRKHDERDEWDLDAEKAMEECEEFKSYNNVLIIVGRKPREGELVDTLKDFESEDLELRLKKLKVDELETENSNDKSERDGGEKAIEEADISDEEDLRDTEES